MSKPSLFKKSNNVFVETGCFVGEGIQLALKSGFEAVYSIEIFEKFYNHCQIAFANNPKVNVVLGDSSKDLYDLIQYIDEPITFWLDGHFSGEGTGRGEVEFPLIEELEQIKQHHIKNHVLYIDDIRCWKNYSDKLNLDLVKVKVLEVNPSYTISYEDGVEPNDILVCEIL